MKTYRFPRNGYIAITLQDPQCSISINLALLQVESLPRLIKQYITSGGLKRRQRTIKGFQTRYTKADIRLLAYTDQLHSDLNGAAIKKICERAYQYGDERYERLATISISHLYNLRQLTTYERVRGHKDSTRSTQKAIGMRRRPDPQGRPGFIRVDTVHQGNKDRVKGLYHINAVDEVTQYEVVCTVEQISERYLVPVLEGLLAGFPFKLLEFHFNGCVDGTVRWKLLLAASILDLSQ